MSKHTVPVLTALAFAALASAAPALAATRLVPGQYPTIQAAVDAALPGDQVVVASGIYRDVTHPAGGGDTTKCAVIMKSNITVSGAGVGATIVECDTLGRGFYCNAVTNSTIEGITVRRAFAATYGAGILCRNGSSPTIRNCEVTACRDGGIIVLEASSPAITNCRLTNNLAKEGGGLAIDTNCNPIVTACIITGNTAPGGGGVLIKAGSAAVLRWDIVSDNFISHTSAGNGGGITITSSPATLENCLIENNDASSAGGGLYIEGNTSIVTINNCLIQGNVAYGAGGGLFAGDNSNVTVTDCTITRNTVLGEDTYAFGAGVSAFYATQFTVRQCTIAANANYAAQGAGIAVGHYLTFTPTIDKCIIADNGPGEGMLCYDQAAPVVSCTDLYGNQGGDAICGTDAGHNFSLDPRFCDLAGNDFHLQSNSPCAPGHHPDGPTACNGSRIGGEDVGCVATGVDQGAAPISARLLGNEPNPSHATTVIRFELAHPGRAVLRVFDVAGRQVRILQDGVLGAGLHEVAWDGRNDGGALLPSGIYFYRLNAEGADQARRMVLTR